MRTGSRAKALAGFLGAAPPLAEGRTVQLLATNVNSGTDYSGKYFQLTTDIDLSSVCGANVNSGMKPLCAAALKN